jgi:hypothetical protein
VLFLTFIFIAFVATPLASQFKGDKKPDEKPAAPSADPKAEPPKKPAGIQLDKELVQRIKLGLVVKAGAGGASGMYGTIPVPIDWPEQTVKIISEDPTPQARIEYRMVDGTVKQMVVRIANLKSGETAKALVTVEVRRRAILAPDQTSGFQLPDKAKFDADPKLKAYTKPSPKIESGDKRIVAAAKQVAGTKEKAWEKVEAIYDWVREKVEYRNGPLKGAVAALKDGNGDCEELTSLFIAMCRAVGIPARTVWVPGHCYPEFYLVDEEGKGHWFPCQAAGSRAFGGIPEFRPILQKGDNFFDKDRPRERLRYMSEHFTCKIVKGAPPTVKFIRQDVATEESLDGDQRTDVAPPAESDPPAESAPPTKDD